MKRRGRIGRKLTPRLCVLLDVGPPPVRLEGEDDASLEEMWGDHRDWMLRPERRHWPGDRPWAFWRFEIDVPTPATPEERIAFLAEHDLLDAAEVVALTRRNGEPG